MPAPGPAHYGPEDLSNSQYVLLALWVGHALRLRGRPEDARAHRQPAARRAGQVGGPREQRVLDPSPDAERGDEPLRRHDAPEGRASTARAASATRRATAPTGSMTTAGLSSLAIVKAMLLETARPGSGSTGAARPGHLGRDRLARPPLHDRRQPADALAGLALLLPLRPRARVRDRRQDASSAITTGTATVRILLIDAQQEDGRWQPPSARRRLGAAVRAASTTRRCSDTCFALLFLKRAALLPKVPLLPQPVVTPSEPVPPKGP